MSVGTGSIKRAAAKAAESEKAALDAAGGRTAEETVVSAGVSAVNPERKPAKAAESRGQKPEAGKKAQASKRTAGKSAEKTAKKKRQDKPVSAKQEKEPKPPKNAGGYETYGVGQPLPIHLL